MDRVSQSTKAKHARIESAVYSLNETASLFGMGYTTLWTQVQEGVFPIQPIQIGRNYKFPKRIVDRMLSLGHDEDEVA